MKVPPLKEKDLQELLTQPIVAKIATTSPAGDIRITPIWFGHQDGSFLMSTFEGSEVVRNLRGNPKCSLLIDSTEWPYIGAHYWGAASVEGPENDAEAIGRLFAKYFNGDVAAATDYGRRLISMGKRVFLRFRPQRSISWDFRG